MTDERDHERARALARKIIERADTCKGIADCLDMMQEALEAFAAQVRREALGEAAQIVNKKAQEPWKSAKVKRELSSVMQAIRERARG